MLALNFDVMPEPLPEGACIVNLFLHHDRYMLSDFRMHEQNTLNVPPNANALNEYQIRLKSGDINAADDFCKAAKSQGQTLSNSSKYSELCRSSNDSYAEAKIYQSYQKMLLADRSVSREDVRVAKAFWEKAINNTSDKATTAVVNAFLESPQISVPEYRVFDYNDQNIRQHYRAHTFFVLRNPELSGSAVWLRKAKHPAIFSTDGTRPTVIERWYKENGSFHRAIASDEGRLIGSITLDPIRKQEVYLLDIDGDRIVDISATFRNGSEVIMVKPEAMYFLDQWRAGSNALCGLSTEGGPLGTDQLSSISGALVDGPQPPVVNGCSLSPRGRGGMGSIPTDFSVNSSPCNALEGLAVNAPSPGQGFMESVCKSQGHSVGGGSSLVADQINRAPCIRGPPCHFNTDRPPRQSVTPSDFFNDGFGEMTQEDTDQLIQERLAESTPVTSEDTGQSGSCSGGICDMNGDGTADAYDSDDDGVADASCDPCSSNESTNGTTEPVSPEQNNSFASYCASVGTNYRQTILDMCQTEESGEAGETDCDDPVINPDPRIRGIASLSQTEASAASGGDKVGGLTCAEVPGRAGILEADCLEGNPVIDPSSPDQPVPCLSGGNGAGGNVSLDSMFGSALTIEFCDPRLCSTPEELFDLGAAANLRTDQL